jgi:hypothetical protein
MKWEVIGLGGNIQALEATFKGYQILVSNGYGDVPDESRQYRMDIYAKGNTIEFTDKPLRTFRGDCLILSEVFAQAKQFINEQLARSNRS